jgi:hypothetical protein
MTVFDEAPAAPWIALRRGLKQVCHNLGCTKLLRWMLEMVLFAYGGGLSE